MNIVGEGRSFGEAWQTALELSAGEATLFGCPPLGEPHPLLAGVQARLRLFITGSGSDDAAIDITIEDARAAISLAGAEQPDVAVQATADGVARWLGDATCLLGDLEWRTLRFGDGAEQLAALSVIEGGLWLSGLTDRTHRP